jgi:hypothetical protein
MEMGRNKNYIYVMNLGLATKYRSNRAPQNVPSNPHFLSTAVFVSVISYFGVDEFFCRFRLLIANREVE